MEFPTTVIFVILVHSCVLYTAFQAYQRIKNRYETAIIIWFWAIGITHYIHEAHDKTVMSLAGEEHSIKHFGLTTNACRQYYISICTSFPKDEVCENNC